MNCPYVYMWFHTMQIAIAHLVHATNRVYVSTFLCSSMFVPLFLKKYSFRMACSMLIHTILVFLSPCAFRCITVTVHRVCSVKGWAVHYTVCHGIYTLDSSTRLLTRTFRGEALRYHENVHFWAVQTLHIYLMFKRFPLDGELFGLVISWPLFNPSRTKYVISCVKLFFFEPHVLDDLVSVVSVSEKNHPCGPDHAKNRPVRTTES